MPLSSVMTIKTVQINKICVIKVKTRENSSSEVTRFGGKELLPGNCSEGQFFFLLSFSRESPRHVTLRRLVCNSLLQIKMAAPHGVKLKDLKCDFTDPTAARPPQDAQVLYVFLLCICRCRYEDVLLMIMCRKDAQHVNTWTWARARDGCELTHAVKTTRYALFNWVN